MSRLDKYAPGMEKLKPMIDDIMEKNDGWEVIQKIIQESQEPAVPLAQFLAQFIVQLGEALLQKGSQVDMNVFLAEGGVVEYMLDLIERAFDLPEAFSDQIFDDVVSTIEAVVQDPAQAQQAQQGPPQGQPPQQAGGLQAMGGM